MKPCCSCCLTLSNVWLLSQQWLISKWHWGHPNLLSYSSETKALSPFHSDAKVQQISKVFTQLLYLFSGREVCVAPHWCSSPVKCSVNVEEDMSSKHFWIQNPWTNIIKLLIPDYFNCLWHCYKFKSSYTVFNVRVWEYILLHYRHISLFHLTAVACTAFATHTTVHQGVDAAGAVGALALVTQRRDLLLY